MRVTMDKAGRLVIPKPLRDELGFEAGEVEIVCDGAALRIEAVVGKDLAHENGRTVIPPSGRAIDDALVEALQEADRR